MRGASRSVSTSGWPAVQISPTAPVRPSTSALVATVVPCTMRCVRARKSARSQPKARAASSSASRNPRSNAGGVDGALITASLAPSETTQSVKVPPMSIETWYALTRPPLPSPQGRAHPRNRRAAGARAAGNGSGAGRGPPDPGGRASPSSFQQASTSARSRRLSSPGRQAHESRAHASFRTLKHESMASAAAARGGLMPTSVTYIRKVSATFRHAFEETEPGVFTYPTSASGTPAT